MSLLGPKIPSKGGPNKEEWEGEGIRILVDCNQFSHKGLRDVFTDYHLKKISFDEK